MSRQTNDIENAEIQRAVSQSELIEPLEAAPDFPPLYTGENRPVAWHYGLDSVKGCEHPTNTVTILSRVAMACDESGENGNEKFAVVTLTRAEIAKILQTLEADIADMRKYCPSDTFV